VGAFFSWRIFVGDIKTRKVDNWDIAGLLAGGGLMCLAGASFEVSIIRPIIVFLIGWGIFQLFEGDIGGGDVRLATVVAVFLNMVQLLSAISLAAAAGMIIGSRLKMKTVPFGSLLIVASWLSFWIVRFR
jgi:Flp pilus assembly protein protease CpaA